jgi:hypothetical protein
MKSPSVIVSEYEERKIIGDSVHDENALERDYSGAIVSTKSPEEVKLVRKLDYRIMV